MKTLGNPLIKAGRVLAVLVLFLFCVISTANALWVGGNIDVHNNTGQDAHDFHIEGQIKSTTPPTLLLQIGYVDPGAVPFDSFNHTITSAGGDLWNFEAEWWMNQPIPHCSVGHFGLFFNATCRNVWVDLDGWWTDENGKRIGDWPILGFEVPTHFWDAPEDQLFRLQGATFATEIVSMDLMLMHTDAPETLFKNLNANDMDRVGNWSPVNITANFQLQPDSFFDVFTETVFDTGVGIEPNQLLLARTLVAWPGEPGGRWFFHVHQAHSENKPPVADAGDDQIVEQDSLGGASVTLDGSGSYDPESAPLTYLWTWDSKSATGVNPTVILPLGTTTVTLVVNDGILNSTPDTIDITVQDTTPPTLICPPDITVEQETPDGTVVPLEAKAKDICDADVEITSDELEIYPLGSTTVTFTATDDSGNSSTGQTVVTVIDTTPPEILLDEPVPSELWPPNHKFVDVTITGEAIDICDIDLGIDVSIEVIDAEGGGGGPEHEPDYEIVSVTIDEDGYIEIVVSLRAERSGKGDGRIYRITAEVTDGSGQSSSDTVEVLVPHDRRR